VRFAPSPTGHLHVGGARTALFNWLFARHHGGVFVLRIEDTDAARNRPEYTQAIYDGLHWLGLDWDEGPDKGGPYEPYLQSRRAQRHLEVTQELLARGHAYECFCQPRTADSADTSTFASDDGDDDSAEPAVVTASAPTRSALACTCAGLSAEERDERRTQTSPALRFKVPKGSDFTVDDLIRGNVSFPADMVEDFVLVTGDGRTLYNLAATVDDHEMAITHVIRGEEHLANTPKQQLIYQAMGWTAPRFAHIPIILNAQRRKLSKRDGATSLVEYQAMGYVPDAVVNFLALLGWSPGGNREVLSRTELVELFDLDRVVKHPAIFDTAKLGWLNKEYIKAAPPSDLAARVSAFMNADHRGADRHIAPAYVEKVAALFHDRVKTVVEVLELGSYFFADGAIVPNEDALAKYCTDPHVVERLLEVREALAATEPFDTANVERAIRELAAAKNLKPSEYIHPLRVALTGQSVSPGIFGVCSILGRKVVVQRIEALVELLRAASAAKVGR
jgi:nondiscriminating glutamyl-tRNA synthetase